jgi:hypothetical protein
VALHRYKNLCLSRSNFQLFFSTQLGGALTRMEDTWRIEFLHSTHVLHPNFVCISFAFSTIIFLLIFFLSFRSVT